MDVGGYTYLFGYRWRETYVKVGSVEQYCLIELTGWNWYTDNVAGINIRRSLPQILWSRLHRSGSHYFRAVGAVIINYSIC